MITTESPLTIANGRLTIIQACNLVGMDVPDFEYGSPKLYCPFGELRHQDGGRSKAFRVYPPENTAYCFACGEFFNPVKLIATSRGITDAEAAESILEETGYVPPDIDSRWQAAIAESFVVDTDSLSEALKIACERMAPDWELRQFDEDVARKFRQCLGLLVKVHSEGEASTWLATTKIIMQRVLGASS